MAKAVSQAFKDAWTNKHGARIRLSVQWQRRHFTGGVYVYLPAYEELDIDRWVTEIPSVRKALDPVFKSVFSISTVTLRVANLFNEWIESANAPSVWARDGVAVNGYFPPLTRFKIRIGVIKQDGTTEWATYFTGYLIDMKPGGHKPHMDLVLAAGTVRLEQTPVSEIVDVYALEDTQPAVGDNDIVDFKTTSKGVAEITDVQVNAVSQNQGSDWTVSNLDDFDEADVSIRVAPGVGDTVKTAGTKWKQDIAIEDLVGLIYDKAGIPPGERAIEPVIVPGGISGSKTIDSEPEWAAGSLLQNVTETAFSGDLTLKWVVFDDFNDGTLLTPVWTRHIFTAGGTQSNPGTFLQTVVQDGDHQIRTIARARTLAGTWSFDVTVGLSGTGTGTETFVLPWADQGFSYTGYGIRIDHLNGSVSFGRIDLGGVGATENYSGLGALAGFSHSAGTVTYTISRDAVGEWKVYTGTTLRLTVTDATHTVFNFFRIADFTDPGSSLVNNYDNLVFSPAVLNPATDPVVLTAPRYESEEFDLLATPSSFGILAINEILNSGTTAYETDVAAISGGPFDGFVAISPSTKAILSTPRQYFKIGADLTGQFNTSGDLEIPRIEKLVADFLITSINLAVAKMRGKRGLSYVQRLARASDYEVGVSDEDVHFFRARQNNPSVITLDGDNFIIDVVDWSPGWDRVRNAGEVNYLDSYVARYDKDDAGEAEPTSERRFERKVETDDLSDLFLANDLLLADARARLIYERNFQPKRRLVLKIWLVPWFELGDKVTVNYFDHPIMKALFWGDPLTEWDSPYFGGGLPENVLANSLDMRILRIDADSINARDPRGITGTIEVEEVLT